MSKQIVNLLQEYFGKDEVNAIQARDLWEQIDISQTFRDWSRYWIRNNTDYTEGQDWNLAIKNDSFCRGNIPRQKDNRGGHNQKDYIISIEMAQNIALMSKTAAGKKYRKKLLQTERKYIKLLRNQLKKQKTIRKKPPLTILERAEQLFIHIPKNLLPELEGFVRDQYHIQYYRKAWPPERAERKNGYIVRNSEFAKKDFTWLDKIIHAYGLKYEDLPKKQQLEYGVS